MKLLYPERPKELDETLRAYVWRRLQFVLGRFRPRIKWVRVYIDNTEVTQERGEKQCRLVADVLHVGEVIVKVSNVDLYEAIDLAADRLAKSIGRKLERLRELNNSTKRSLHKSSAGPYAICDLKENKSPGPYGSKKQNIMVSKNGNPWRVS